MSVVSNGLTIYSVDKFAKLKEESMSRFFVLLSLLTLCCFSFEASAYSFAVKVRNSTGHDLAAVSAAARPKGSTKTNYCFNRQPISAGGSYSDSCSWVATEKWQRQIKVYFTCPGQGRRSITFPRNGKFYNRDHATRNSDRYTVTLKASDC